MPKPRIETKGDKLIIRDGKRTVEVPFSSQSSLLSPAGRAAVRIAENIAQVREGA